MAKIDYLSKDYEAFRTDMINQIPRLFPEWTDFSSSDMGVVLLELFAHGLDVLSYYQDRLLNESYLSTATQRQSVIDLCNLLGYRLQEATPSTTNVVFEVVPGTALTIPRRFQVRTATVPGEPRIIFELNNDLIIPAGNNGLETNQGVFIHQVPVTQGISVQNEIVGSSSGTSGQKFKLAFPSVLEGSLQLFVNEGTGFILWEDITDNPTQSTLTGRHYWREIDGEGFTFVSFGGGLDGRIPPTGVNNIQVSYRIGGGAHTNVGSNSITEIVSSLSRVVRVFNPLSATGGTDKEEIEEARKNAPRFFRSSNRAVTKRDYEVLTEQIPGVIKAHAVQNPSILTGVIVYIVGQANQNFTVLHNNILNFLNQRKAITTQITVLDAERVSLNVQVNASLHPLSSRAVVQTLITNIIQDLLNATNRDFGQGEPMFRFFSLLGAIPEISSVDIPRLTTIPRAIPVVVAGNATWSTITVNAANTTRGIWRVLMTSPTAFSVSFDTTGMFTGAEIPRGTGTLNTPFTSTGNEISFTITAGTSPMAIGNRWTFEALPFRGDITILSREFLTLGNLTINLTGGVA